MSIRQAHKAPNVVDIVTRLAYRGKREVYAKVPLAQAYIQARDRRRLESARPALPDLNSVDQSLVGRLRRYGAVVTTLDALDLPGSDELRSGLLQLRELLAARIGPGPTSLRPSRDELLRAPGVWQWGLSDRLLDFAENCVGMPVRYHGADMRWEGTDGQLVGARQWHRDTEDFRVLKILVWLNDVDLSGGPFEYIERQLSDQTAKSMRYVSGFVKDEEMERQVARAQWVACTGPTWTAVIADTAAVFHRAVPATVTARYSATFTWTSRHPIQTHRIEPFGREHSALVRQGLTQRQANCLPVCVG